MATYLCNSSSVCCGTSLFGPTSVVWLRFVDLVSISSYLGQTIFLFGVLKSLVLEPKDYKLGDRNALVVHNSRQINDERGHCTTPVVLFFAVWKRYL